MDENSVNSMFGLEAAAGSMTVPADLSFPQETGSSWWPQGLPSVSDIFSTLGTAALIRGANEIAGTKTPGSGTGKQGTEGILGKLGTVGVQVGLDETVKVVLIVAALGIVAWLLRKKRG